MTEEDTPGSDIARDIKEELKPLEVTITNHPIIKETHPTSHDTVDEWDIIPTDEEIKEMQDAE